MRGDALARPALRGDRERLLDGVLGEVEVAERADQDRNRAPILLPECRCYRFDRLPLEDDDGAHLDRAVLGRRDARRNREGLVRILRLDQVVAALVLPTVELKEVPCRQ